MMATEIEETKSGLRFRIGETHYGVPLHGTHNVANILLAISVGEEFGLRPEAIAEKLKTFSPLHRTFEVREERGVTILDDTHNASAASFQAAVTWADTQPFEHKVLLASGIIELGEENARTHREIGVLASGVFEKVYFLDKKSGALFGEGFGRRVDALTTNVAPLDSSSLLVCVGRMPPSIIQSLLP